MPYPALSGRPGSCIKIRLESAAIRLKQVHGWEDLRLYLIQDDKWLWDDAIVLDWQEDIIDYFLESCKDFHDEATIQGFATALSDGQQLETDTKVAEVGGSVEENSDHATVKPRHHPETRRSKRMIFLINRGKPRYEGLNVGYDEAPMSRVGEEIIKKRWGMKDDIYQALVPDIYGNARNSLVVDLTWESDSTGKTQVTTFEVVPDNQIEHDAEFGRNKDNPPSGRAQTKWKGHSISKSESAVETSQKPKPTTIRSPGAKSTTSSHRRQTMPTSSSRQGHMNREEFVLQQVVKGLNLNANLEYDKQQQALLEAEEEDEEGDDEEDDEADVFEIPGRGHAHMSPDTSVSERKSDRAGRRRK